MSSTAVAAAPERSHGPFNRSDLITIAGAVLATIAAGVTHYVHVPAVVAFICSAAAVTFLASLVGLAVEQLGDRFGAGATGVLQSALGNLPELFISLFALRAGMVGVVQAALIGSILANLLLVLGISFLAGGLKHGTQKLNSERARGIIVLMVVSVAALIMPSAATWVHAPAMQHEKALSMLTALVLLALFVASLPASLRKEQNEASSPTHTEAPRWPVWLAVVMLAAAATASAFVSDWFVSALEPAMHALHISEAFAGLVVVAIAGNAIENVVGVQLALANRSEYAFSVIINSPIQIALVLAPALVLLSSLLGFTPLTLVFSPMLVVAVFVAVLLSAFITFDGESNWAEGAALIGLYVIIAAAFWWG